MVDTLNEKVGNIRIYNVTLTRYVAQDGTSGETSQVLETYTCCSTTVGDTLLGSTPGKKYLFTFGDSQYPPLRAYTYYEDSLWHFLPLTSNSFLTNIAFKMPLKVGQGWQYQPLNNPDNYNVSEYEFNIYANDNCYTVGRIDGNSVNNQSWTSLFYVNSKGIPVFQYNYLSINSVTGGHQLDQYKIVTIWSNIK